MKIQAVTVVKHGDAFEFAKSGDPSIFIDDASHVLDTVLDQSPSVAPYSSTPLSGDAVEDANANEYALVDTFLYKRRGDFSGRDRCPPFSKCPYPIAPPFHSAHRTDPDAVHITTCWKLLGRWGFFALADRSNLTKIYTRIQQSMTPGKIEYFDAFIDSVKNLRKYTDPELPEIDPVICFYWVLGDPISDRRIGFKFDCSKYEFYGEVGALNDADCERWLDAEEERVELCNIVSIPIVESGASRSSGRI